MPFGNPQSEKSRLVWWNCKEIPPLPCKDLSTKSKICSRHLSSSSMDCNWSFLSWREKNSNILDLYMNMRVVPSVAGLNCSMLQRLSSHKVISPALWQVAGTRSILPQNPALSKAAVAHEWEAPYSTVGIHLHQQTFTSQNTAVGREGTVCKSLN